MSTTGCKYRQYPEVGSVTLLGPNTKAPTIGIWNSQAEEKEHQRQHHFFYNSVKGQT